MARKTYSISSPVEREAFRYRDPKDDPSRQCVLALNGGGPIPFHCASCNNALRPPRGYQVYDYLGRVIVSTKVEPL